MDVHFYPFTQFSRLGATFQIILRLLYCLMRGFTPPVAQGPRGVAALLLKKPHILSPETHQTHTHPPHLRHPPCLHSLHESLVDNEFLCCLSAMRSQAPSSPENPGYLGQRPSLL